jgi:hypothetical protein
LDQGPIDIGSPFHYSEDNTKDICGGGSQAIPPKRDHKKRETEIGERRKKIWILKNDFV